MGETRFDLKGDSSEVVSEIDKTTAAFRDLVAASKLLQGELDAVTKAKRQTKTEATAVQKELAGLKKMAGGLGLGGTANDVEDLAGGMSTLHPATLLASAAVLGLAMDLKLLKASISFVFNATMQVEELSAELQRLQGIEGFEPIDPALQSSVRDATASYAALGAILDELTIIIGAGWAPTVEMATEAGVRLGMVAIDIERSFSDVANGTSSWYFELLDLHNGLGKVDERSNELIDTMRREQLAAAVLESATGSSKDAAKEAGDVAEEAHREAEKAARLHEKAVREADRAYRELMGTARDLNTAFKKGEQERLDALAKVATANARARDIAIEQREVDAEANAKTIAADRHADAERQQRAEDYQKRLDDIRSAQVAAFMTAGTAVQGLAAVITDSLKEGTEAQRAAAMASFAIQKGMGLAQVYIDSKRAVMAALADPLLLGPAKGVAVGLAVTAGIANAAAIAAAPAPKFHDGYAGSARGLAPDERNAIVKNDEPILSVHAARRMGGPRGVRATNNGTGGGGSVVVQNVYRQRMYGVMYADAARQAGPVRREHKKGRRPAGRSQRHITIHQGDL